jgi:anti-sigma regulatory factor (Ser/Thr protein kinase)
MRARLSLRNDSADLARLTEFASEFTRRHRLVDEETARLQIILDELFTNVVNHGYEATAGGATAGEATAGEEHREGHIDVALSLEGDRLIIEFVDDGQPFDPLTGPLPDLDLPAETRPIGGVGIAIVRALVDESSYRREGDRNCLTLSRKVLCQPTTG